ncbi:MAG: DUF4238 domain-containing protein [Immundisolibacter sp.]|uniref:DUF4238 domain-containing protein n=1 Tax=Immundisolibacter sp. TaxID=1934948 RepID=UPI003EDF586C
MSTPKRHHFVPESYLTGFSEEESGFLNIYSKRSGLWRRQKPKQVMVRNNYYRQHWVPDGVDKNILEKRVGQQLEPQGLASLRKVVAEPELATDDDSANILAYIEFQRFRVPRQADMAKEIVRTALTTLLMQDAEGCEALRQNRINVNDSIRFKFLRLAIGRLTPYMSRMLWDIVQAEDGASFITSDSPVTFMNVDFPPPAEAGIALYGTIVLFPIDSKHMIVMRHPEFIWGEKGASERLPREHEIEEGVIEIRRNIVWDRQAVNNHNWLIFQLSQDLIVGCCKETIDAVVGMVTRGN